MESLEGKTAVITGAASGIGLGLAERFVAARMNVVLADIQQDALENAVKHLTQRQGSVTGVKVNTMVRESVEDLAEKAIETYGKVHVLCNNAGVAASAGGVGRAVWEVADADWDWVMGVNFNGVLYGLQTFIPHMLAHGEESHIVNTASLAGLMAGGGTYGVSKHGVLCLTESLYNDLKARNCNISASVLCPGFVNTRIFDAERNRPDELKLAAEGKNEAITFDAQGLLEQGLAPADVAEIVVRAILDDDLYILPHPAWDDILRSRLDHVLARGAPAMIDFSDIMARMAQGEQF